MRKKISVSDCSFSEAERQNVNTCLSDGWITMGRWVEQFESDFADYCGAKHAVATCNGTTALHVALLAAGIGPGDEVIIPNLTYVATANCVKYCGATPVLCDVDDASWGLDPEAVDAKISSKTRAIIPVHLYGCPCDMSSLKSLVADRRIAIIEDAAEAHGAVIGDSLAGCVGDVGSFSFYGNKLITTGEGGMCITDSSEIADSLRLLRGQGTDYSVDRYWHSVVGYNYRMTDLQAAIGCAQLPKLDAIIAHHRNLAAVYHDLVHSCTRYNFWSQTDMPDCQGVHWLYALVLPPELTAFRDRILDLLAEDGIETRKFFYPIHELPPYRSCGESSEFPVSERLAHGGICLPTHLGVTMEDAGFVIDRLLVALDSCL